MDEILNSNSVNDVRFRMSKPQGYYAEDVDRFIDEQVKSSLAAYELTIKELQTSNYSLELQVKELNDEMTALRIKADFSVGQAMADEDSLLAQSIEKQEALELEIKALKLREQELEHALKEWQDYAAQVEALVNNQTSTPTVETTNEAYYEEPTQSYTEPEPEHFEEPQPYVQQSGETYAEPESPYLATEQKYTPEPVYEEPQPTYTPEPVYEEPQPTYTPEPVEETISAPAPKAEDALLSSIMMSVESEISDDELQRILAEEGVMSEEERYGGTDKIRPEDLQ
jgi:hypothetical protein